MKKFTRLLSVLALTLAASVTAIAQNSVSGTVRDENSEPVIGASVVVKNTALGTITDLDGGFKLELPKLPSTLVISYLGYETAELAVESAGAVEVALVPASNNLDEVVVTGLATTVQRSNLANSVATVTSQQLTGITTQPTVDGALYGKIAGANIYSNSGSPGGGMSIKLRGITTINASSQPLFIIDGVYIDNSAISGGLTSVTQSVRGGRSSNQDNPSNRLADIDPEDIERIEVLKGASAAAIYGSRAAAGVVIITTKRGKAGKTRVNLTQSFGMSSVIKLLGTRDWDTTKVRNSFGADDVPLYLDAVATGKMYDYEKELYGNKGFLSTTRMSVSGGNERTSFFAGFTYKTEDGILKNTGYEKASVRLNVDHEIFKFMKLSVSSNFIHSSADRGYFNNDNTSTTVGLTLVGTPPWAELHPDANGNYPDNPYSGGNFLQTVEQVTNNEKVNRLISGATLTTRLFQNDYQNLQLILRGGVDYYTLVTNAIFPRTLQFQKNGNGTDGASIYGTTTNQNTNLAAFLVHTLHLKNAPLSFRTQLGVTQENFDQNSVLNTATFLLGSQTNLDQASSILVDQTRKKQTDKGFFVQEEFNWADRVLVTLGIRGDKSSNNGNANKLYYYPKASLAINLHEFDFWGINNFDQCKLRVAYGQSGNFAPFGAIYTPMTPAAIGGNTGSIITVERGNRNLGPERQTELEFGFDLGFFKERIAFDFTYYMKNVDDLILPVNVPLSSGFTRQWLNAAAIANKGIEIGFSATPVATESFNWLTRVSFWRNNAKVTRLDVPAYTTGAFATALGMYYIQNGYSPTQIVGVGPEAQDPDGDGLVVFGNAEPDFNMAFSNSLTYKNLELTFNLHWKKGGENINLTTLLADIFGTSPDYDGTNLDPSGQLVNGDYRLNALGTTTQPWVEDASYVRLREIGLFYHFPKKMLKKMEGIRIGITGRNLLNFFTYSSYDPEVSNFGTNAISSSVEVTPFPSSKSFFVTLGVTF